MSFLCPGEATLCPAKVVKVSHYVIKTSSDAPMFALKEDDILEVKPPPLIDATDCRSRQGWCLGLPDGGGGYKSD